MARERQLEAAAEAVAEHRRDHRLVELLDRGEHPQPLVEHGLEPAAFAGARHELLEVHADAEVLFARGGDHDGPRVAVVAQCDHGAFELVHVLERHPVARRILVLEDHHPAPPLDAQRGAGHRSLPGQSVIRFAIRSTRMLIEPSFTVHDRTVLRR